MSTHRVNFDFFRESSSYKNDVEMIKVVVNTGIYYNQQLARFEGWWVSPFDGKARTLVTQLPLSMVQNMDSSEEERTIDYLRNELHRFTTRREKIN